MNKKVLITGVNGFLGRAVQKQMPSDWHIIKLLNPKTNLINNDNAASIFYDVESLPIDELNRPKAVIHLAARIPYDNDVPIDDIEYSNLILVERLVKKYPNARHILASSVSVYGELFILPLTIKSPLAATTHYGQTKFKAEKIVSECLSFTIIRYSSIVGPGMSSKTFIPNIVDASLKGEIKIFGDGSRLQNYISIIDAADMCINALNSKNNLIALGVGSRSYTNLEIANILAIKTGAMIRHVEGRQGPSYIYKKDENDILGLCKHSIEEVIDSMLKI